MARVYSTNFAHMHGGVTQTYTVPDGFIAVIRCITSFNASIGIPEQAQVVLGHSSVTIYQKTLSPYLPTSLTYYDCTEMRVVVEATDVITVYGDGDIDMTVSGYLLTTP